MKGKVLDYNLQESKGIISADNGNRYDFLNSEWKGDKLPKIGQIVDFVVEENQAKGIYIDSSSVSINTDEIKNKFNEIKNSEKVNGIISNGVQHKSGFIISIIVLIGLFLPIISIPFVGKISLLDTDHGKLISLGVLGVSFLFYSGIQDKLLKILTIVISVLILYTFISLFMGLNNAGNLMNAFNTGRNSLNLFQLLSFGTYIMFPVTILLLITGIKIKTTKVN